MFLDGLDLLTTHVYGLPAHTSPIIHTLSMVTIYICSIHNILGKLN
jgi:hypothetical protein